MPAVNAVPLPTVEVTVRAVFTRMGWTAADWDDLDNPNNFTGFALVHHWRLREWLRDPPAPFRVPVSAATVRETFALYGHVTWEVLQVYAAGASARFVAAHLSCHRAGLLAVAWDEAQENALSERAATGWALTSHLVAHRWGVGVDRWAFRFGEAAYLWVLAGYTFEEARDMRTAGTMPGEDQLRVMAALNGKTLPPGI
ncbi:MAG: hypothetical protein ACOH1Y_14320 [Propionicimonas sp.]